MERGCAPQFLSRFNAQLSCVKTCEVVALQDKGFLWSIQRGYCYNLVFISKGLDFELDFSYYIKTFLSKQ